MKPIKFKEQNRVLAKPESMTDEQCNSLPVYAKDGVCTSCWKMTFRERLDAALFGKIWARVLTGTSTQPPIFIDCKKTIFKAK
ncbi:MAG: hypothetical protein LBL90_03685 [Prevotellaceae bacterium]|jgi:hypothetical protein|nr:hypothetical protein [Prevotellaceae bacterium]